MTPLPFDNEELLLICQMDEQWSYVGNKKNQPYKFRFYCTDDWKPYGSELPEDIHVVTKKLTQSIERTNLTLRARLKRLTRKTICFSRSEELHDKVTGEFISRMWHQPV